MNVRTEITIDPILTFAQSVAQEAVNAKRASGAEPISPFGEPVKEKTRSMLVQALIAHEGDSDLGLLLANWRDMDAAEYTHAARGGNASTYLSAAQNLCGHADTILERVDGETRGDLA